MKILLFLFSCISLGSIAAQTKVIAHKSHSGSMSNFHLLEENGAFTSEHADYGQAPERFVRYAKLDSVIRLSDTVAIMVTSQYCSDQYSTRKEDTKWRAGKDTIRNHHLFSSQLPVEKIRDSLKLDYYFRNNMDSVVFIGFKKQAAQQQQSQEQNQQQNLQQHHKNEAPIWAPDNNSKPPFFPTLLLFAVVALIAIFVGLVTRVLRAGTLVQH